MLKTLLFDLDGTLLHVDMDYFLKKYFKALISVWTRHMPPEVFMSKLRESMEAMMKNENPDKTNEDIFKAHFFNGPEFREADLMPVFVKFYQEEYGHLRQYTRVKPEAFSLLQKAQELGFELVIATNPVFPAAAVRERLRWAGVDTFNYILVTTYENMHFCKPNLNYYREILAKVRRSPKECIMVGNDVEDDMVAADLGIKTFLVDDLLINNNDSPIQTDRRGSLKDVEKYLTAIKGGGKA